MIRYIKWHEEIGYFRITNLRTGDIICNDGVQLRNDEMYGRMVGNYSVYYTKYSSYLLFKDFLENFYL